MDKKVYKEKSIPLNCDRRLINACKKAGIQTYNPQGPWNGYGYTKLPMCAKITTLGEMRKFNQIKKQLEDSPKKAPRVLSDEDKALAWARRLVKLAPTEYDLTVDEALEIAHEKLEYQQDRINMMEQRQSEFGYSKKRQSCINKMYRENPLRRITDENHALRVLEAHNRHANSHYDRYLEEAHILEEIGKIEKGNAKELARERLRKGDEWWYQEVLGLI